MNESDSTILAAWSNTTLSRTEFLRYLARHNRLRPLLLEVIAERVVCEAARSNGLSVDPLTLQQAANQVRRSQGLLSAAATYEWFQQEGLNSSLFEEGLERRILVEKFREHLALSNADAHFAKNSDDYTRLVLGTIALPREDLARELLSQIRDEGEDFWALARQHSNGLPIKTVAWKYQLVAPVLRAVSLAKVGDLLGPVPLPDGFNLVFVSDIIQPTMDQQTRNAIRDRLFDNWLTDQFRGNGVRIQSVQG